VSCRAIRHCSCHAAQSGNACRTLAVELDGLAAQVKYELLWGMLSGTGLWKQLALSVALNWIVGPLLMVGLAWATLPDQASGNGIPTRMGPLNACSRDPVMDAAAIAS